MGWTAFRTVALLVLFGGSLAAHAGTVPVRVNSLAAPPANIGETTMAAHSDDAAASAAPRVWLRAPRGHADWYAVRLADAWQASDSPLLVIHGNVRARVVAYLPPDYRAHEATMFDAGLDATFSRHAVVYPLPSDLSADQPIYLALGNPGQSQPVRISIDDTAGYRAADLAHIRISTFLTSVQFSMVLVALCFWAVLRDRMFMHFVVYVGALALYGMSVTGELFSLPSTSLLAPLGYHTGQSAAMLAAAFSIWFVLEFEELAQHTPLLARWLGALRWPYLALAIVIWIPFAHPDAWLPNSANLLVVVSSILALGASWLAWRRGSRQAGFFLLSWAPMLALTLARVVQLGLGLRLPGWLEYGFPASMAYSAVVITAGLADRTLQARRERDQATRMAQSDALTGVFNRRAFMERLHAAWDRSELAPEPLAVLFLDIDHFKHINDSRGHAAGDACLVAVTGAIRAELATSDRVGRYGGEEFVVMLRGDSARVAARVAERIVARCAALRVDVGGAPIRLTVSIGVMVRDGSITSAESLVEYADAAQYRAKAEGRNRAVVWRREAFKAAVARAT